MTSVTSRVWRGCCCVCVERRSDEDDIRLISIIVLLSYLLTVCNNYTIWGFIILNMSFWINTELKDIIINPKIGNKTLQNKNKLFRKWNNLIIKILPYHFYKSHHLDWKQSCLTLHCTAWLRLDDNLINIWNLTRGNIHFQSPNVWCDDCEVTTHHGPWLCILYSSGPANLAPAPGQW